jgi:hypothetical protein
VEGGTQTGGSLLDVGQVLLFLFCRKRARVGKLSNWIAGVRHEIPSAVVDDPQLKYGAEKSAQKQQPAND